MREETVLLIFEASETVDTVEAHVREGRARTEYGQKLRRAWEHPLELEAVELQAPEDWHLPKISDAKEVYLVCDPPEMTELALFVEFEIARKQMQTQEDAAIRRVWLHG